jgi:hypothetical protein
MMRRGPKPEKPEPPVEADLYAKAGPSYEEAWGLMSAAIKLPHVPPSLEVFKYERAYRHNRRETLSVIELAGEVAGR